MKSHLEKLERDRKRKAAIRAENRANTDSVPLDNVGDDRITTPIPPASPVLSPPTLPSTPVPGSHDSALSAIASPGSRFDQKFSALSNTNMEMGLAIRSLMEKNVNNESAVRSESAVNL